MATPRTQRVLDGYFSRYNGIEHGEHSVSEEAYEVWVRSRLRQLTRDGGVDDGDAEAIVDALRSLDEGADGAVSRGRGHVGRACATPG